MMIPKEKLNILLSIFRNPKSIPPYNILKEKQEIKNANIFLDNYHKFGSPLKFIKIKNSNTKNKNSNMPNSKVNYKSNINNLKAHKSQTEIELKKSIINLRKGRTKYLKEKKFSEELDLNSQEIVFNIYNYENNFLNKSNHLYHNSNLESKNYYNIFQNNNINININSSFINLYKIKKSKSLENIRSCPEQVIIKDLPPNYVLKTSQISNTNITQNNINTNNNINTTIISQLNMMSPRKIRVNEENIQP